MHYHEFTHVVWEIKLMQNFNGRLFFSSWVEVSVKIQRITSILMLLFLLVRDLKMCSVCPCYNNTQILANHWFSPYQQHKDVENTTMLLCYSCFSFIFGLNVTIIHGYLDSYLQVVLWLCSKLQKTIKQVWWFVGLLTRYIHFIQRFKYLTLSNFDCIEVVNTSASIKRWQLYEFECYSFLFKVLDHASSVHCFQCFKHPSIFHLPK